VDLTGENHLEPGQDYRQSVALPPNAFPPMYLLSQQRCVDVSCRGADSF
jgi:hypothetical protein